MATGVPDANSVSTTIVELEHGTLPTLRLKLTNRAQELHSSKPSETGMMQKLRKKLLALFQKAESETQLEEESSKQAAERNKQKLKNVFDSVKAKIDEKFDATMNEMDSLTPAQQEEVITFWVSASDFFTEVFNWLREMFSKVLDKIKEGWRLSKEAVRDLFRTVLDWLNLVF